MLLSRFNTGNAMDIGMASRQHWTSFRKKSKHDEKPKPNNTSSNCYSLISCTDRNPSLEPSFKWSITSINMVTSATRLTWMDVMLEVSRHHEVKTFQYNLHQQSHCAGTKFAMEGMMRLWLLLETQHYGVEVRLC